jgi:dynein light intermediate chain 1
LDNVANSSIGGTPDSQREFLDTFSADTSADPSLANDKRKGKGKTPPIANQFALGYTYRDVLDADKEGRREMLSFTSFGCSNAILAQIL